MRFMILVKATRDPEAGVMPREALLAEMTAFHEQLAKAGGVAEIEVRQLFELDNLGRG